MSKKHDENKDLKSFGRIGRVNPGDKTLRASKAATIGIHLWGKIDYLTKYCGWVFIWDNNAGTGVRSNNEQPKDTARTAKKAKKEHQLTDKTKKKSNKR